MKERPILFSAPMVRALLSGTKTQTRRAVKLPHANPLGQWGPGMMGGPSMRLRSGETVPEHPVLGHTRTGDVIGPLWWPGDRLWVREAWRVERGFDSKPPRDIPKTLIRYDANEYDHCDDHLVAWGKLRPSMFMPRWASRITLEVTSVRVERLWDISDDDVRAEGSDGHKLTYAKLWESINGAGTWDANPWVWVVEFRRIKP